MENKILVQFNSKIAQDSLEVRLAFYENIGFFIEIAQMLEYNLRELICYERSVKEIERGELTKENVENICKRYDQYYLKTFKEKWALGKLKNELMQETSITQKMFTYFDEIIQYRNLIAHKLFQINVNNNALQSASTVKDYINNRLSPMTNKASELNSFIIKIIRLYQEDLHKYKKLVGMPVPSEDAPI